MIDFCFSFLISEIFTFSRLIIGDYYLPFFSTRTFTFPEEKSIVPLICLASSRNMRSAFSSPIADFSVAARINA
jgi:hypothetical protein